MADLFNFVDSDCSPSCKEQNFTIQDEDTLAQHVAELLMGQYRHVGKVLDALDSTLTVQFHENQKKSIISILRLEEGMTVDKRDGWIFQMISWIIVYLNHHGENFRQQAPHHHPAQQGIDGFAVVVKDGHLKKILITEDKCTTSPRGKITQQVFPEFDKYENFKDTTAIFGLEALMIQDLYQKHVESLAFVTATAYSLKNMLLQQQEESVVSMDYISSDVSTVLHYLIADAVTDAVEVARKFHTADDIQGSLLRYIRMLAEGKLKEIVESETTKEEFHGDYQEYAINLLMNELCEGIKDVALHFLGNTTIKPTERLEQVLLLSSYQIEEFDQIDTYVGIRKIARLLLGVTKHLERAALINIPVPEGVDADQWKSFLYKRCMQGRPFIWRNHGFAIYNRFLDLGVSSIFTYPTGAGKSTIVQLKIASSILADRRVIVLVPTHALESQMKRELSAIFKENFSQQMFAGGEFSEYFEEENKQSIVVMTPERCLTVLGDASDKFNDVGLVVFDEFHLMGTQESGNDSRSLTAMFTMLEIFEKLPQVDFVLLSAMVKNSHDIADWLKSVTHRECLVFDDKWKPTRQLQGCLVYEQTEIKQLQNKARTYPQHKSKKKLVASMLATPWCLFCLKTVWDSQKVRDYSKVKLLNHQISLGISLTTRKLTPNRNQVACQIASAFVLNGLRVMIFVDTPRSAQSIQKKAKDAIPLVDLSALFTQNQAKIDQLTLELGDFSYSYLLNQTSCAVHHGLL